MKQDVNKIIDNLSNDWAGDLANSKKQVAILMEENERLKDKVQELERELEDKETNAELDAG